MKKKKDFARFSTLVIPSVMVLKALKALRMVFITENVLLSVCLWLQARIFAKILRANGFEAYSVVCKVSGQAKSSMGIPAECESIGPAMCNPILQARLLNQAKTDLNVVIGLCVGHDSLFYKYAEAPCTTAVTKDRVLCHNPAAALYAADFYYKKKLFP